MGGRQSSMGQQAMGLIGRISQRLRAALRSWVLGSAVVDPWEAAWGKESQTFQPAEYGDYIATSNGVYACLTLRAQLLSSLPLRLYRLNRAGEKEEVTSGAAWSLLQQVNPFWTGERLINMTELSLGLWGEAFWFLERGASGRAQPREIWWGRPDRVRVVPHATEYISGFLYRANNSLEEIAFEPGEVIWFRYPNPLDEYEGLSPLAAARLSADVASAAMKSNRNLFEQGMQLGGALFPPKGQTLTPEQAEELERRLEKRFKGVDKFHRWGVFRFEAQMSQFGVSPKDAEFLGALNFTLEEICRAYKVPLDLVGGQRSYENVDAAMRMVWEHAVLPEARFIASELIEQLAPLYPEVDLLAFDSSEVEALQERESEAWEREQGQIQAGAITINEWREHKGLEPVAWGDVWWAPVNLLPVASATSEMGGEGETDDEGEPRAARRRAIEFGSDEHQLLWRKFARRTERQEAQFGRAVSEQFKRQKDAVLARLRSKRSAEAAAAEPFDRPEWTRKFREALRPIIRSIVGDAGEAALEDLGLGLAFDLSDPLAARFVERRAQRFARQVNETTWRLLRDNLSEGLAAGESIAELADRVEAVMGTRIRSSAETIARTEVIGASNGGALEAWRQSGVVESKTWLAALDERTRESHVAAHGQTVLLDADFEVGGGRGPAPGQIGVAAEDINCRCTMTAVVAERAAKSQNGHRPPEEVEMAL